MSPSATSRNGMTAELVSYTLPSRRLAPSNQPVSDSGTSVAGDDGAGEDGAGDAGAGRVSVDNLRAISKDTQFDR